MQGFLLSGLVKAASLTIHFSCSHFGCGQAAQQQLPLFTGFLWLKKPFMPLRVVEGVVTRTADWDEWGYHFLSGTEVGREANYSVCAKSSLPPLLVDEVSLEPAMPICSYTVHAYLGQQWPS